MYIYHQQYAKVLVYAAESVAPHAHLDQYNLHQDVVVHGLMLAAKGVDYVEFSCTSDECACTEALQSGAAGQLVVL